MEERREAMKELERTQKEDILFANNEEYISLSTKCVNIFNELKSSLSSEQRKILLLYDDAVADKERFIIDALLDCVQTH